MIDILESPPPFPLRPETAEHRSLQEESRKEANDHRWIESQKAGRDLGEDALRAWEREHWQGFLRARWMEHVGGARFWVELDPAAFGRVWETPEELRPLLRVVFRMVNEGAGTMDLIWWARGRSAQEQRVVRWLLADLSGPHQRYRWTMLP